MRYIAKAFVKIRTKGKRQAVLNSLRKVRIRLEGNKKYLDCDYFLFTENKYGIMQKHDVRSQSKNSINCNHYANGDEDLAVKLFLELAQMRDNTDLHHWFVSEEMFYQGSEVFGIGTYFSLGEDKFDGTIKAHRLTPLELAEAVMRGDIKL